METKIEKFTEASETVAMTGYAQRAYRNAMDMSDDPAERARLTAITVGRQAKRLGLSSEVVSNWLQVAYGVVWVMGGNLNPGLDLKDLRKILLKAMK